MLAARQESFGRVRWKAGHAGIGDPAKEGQGLNLLLITDTSTWNLIRPVALEAIISGSGAAGPVR
jgi:hypothetical protein